MSDLSNVPADMLLNLLRMCTDIAAHRGYEPTYVRVVRESVEEARKPVTAPTTGVQVLRGPDGQWSITGLSEDGLWTLASSLGYAATNCFNDTSDLDRLAWVIETGLSGTRQDQTLGAHCTTRPL